ncbi:MAG: SIS domain-containing protein [Clostridiaceae bacterium]
MNGFIEEVCTQGKLMKEVIRYYKNDGLKLIENIAEEFKTKGMNKVILSGMGSSLYAMDSVRGYLTGKGIRTLSFSAFELSRFQFNHIDDKTLVVVISQSGTSAEVIELVEKVKAVTTVVGIYNNEGCKLSEMVDFALPIKANKEFSITSKTFEFTMLILNVLAHKLTGELNDAFWSELEFVAEWSIQWLEHWEENSQRMHDFAEGTLLFDLLANNASLATARQLSLAYREGLHNCTAVWECADYAHGQFHSSKLADQYLAQMFFPTFVDNTKEMKMLKYILDHGGKVMLYTTSNVEERERLMVVELPRVRESLMPLIESVASETFLGMLFGPTWVKDH